jgi:hypothetical protein
MAMNNILILLTGLILGLSITTISSISFLEPIESFSQKSSSSLSPLHITKHSSNSYALSSGSSHITTFDTTYSILGSVSSIQKSQNLITSTIIDDYNKSPFIGYIIAPKSKSSSDSSKSPNLANPFADKATIKAKIKSEIQKSIDSTKKIKTKEVVIKCDFGMQISKWNCITRGLIG